MMQHGAAAADHTVTGACSQCAEQPSSRLLETSVQEGSAVYGGMNHTTIHCRIVLTHQQDMYPSYRAVVARAWNRAVSFRDKWGGRTYAYAKSVTTRSRLSVCEGACTL
jgi:hypothetical protein